MAKFDVIPGHKTIAVPAPDFSQVPGHAKLETAGVSPMVAENYYHDYVTTHSGQIVWNGKVEQV